MSVELQAIVTREFSVAGERRALLRIGKPAEHPAGDWICPFQVTGLGDERVYEAAGVDGLQALLMALQMVRAQLEPLRRSGRIRWMDGDDLGL